jgi:type I restriction enzyme S subunit
LLPEWLAYSVLSSTGNAYLESESYGGTKVQLSLDDIKSFPLPIPSLDEQRALTSLLDRETAKIDALIAEQQRLIELLQEKRQAVISHAVTKGLNPDAPMKDSGVEWLGEVPEHWSVVKLKHAAKEKVAGPYGASLTKSMYTDAGYRVYGQQQVIPDNFEEGDYYIDDDKYNEMKRYSVSPGDVLISVMGTVGKVAVVPDCVEPGIINPRLVRYHFRDFLIPRFAQKLLLSTPFQEKILLEAKGATMDGLNMQILGDLSLPVPPRIEQEAILSQLRGSLESFDAMSSSVEESLLLLRERRSALISAAVTGQIDVRGLAPEANAA